MIKQSINYSILLSVASALLYWLLKGDPSSFALVVGTVWGCANLCVLGWGVRCILVKEYTGKVIIGMGFLATLKFPLLYGIGYLILDSNIWNPIALITGFSLIFVGMGISLYREPIGRLI